MTPSQRRGHMLGRQSASIVLEKWDVRITDCNSLNGTYVRNPGETTWSRLVPDEPTTLRPGAQIRIAERTLVFDSHSTESSARQGGDNGA